ncbi:MAG: polyphosphate polymerase domain-containing protein [Nocardiopsaceae bacterium]|nr:polyphosphate polymerase domain-containing protein [Nocardiopsaceae bacterium]
MLTAPGTDLRAALLTDAAAGLDLFPGMGLEEVNARAGLQTRIDAKYLLTPDVCAAFLAGLAELGEWSCLEIDGQRRFRYASTYFDTPDLLTYRQHRQGRRRRFKIRTRHYVDTGYCAFEVKLKGAREATDKQRIDHPRAYADRLTGQARRFLEDVLRSTYRMSAPDSLAPAATTSYVRHTLVQRTGAARVTFDTGLVCTAPSGQRVEALPLWAVETKSDGSGGAAERLLWSLGARPLRISKYCLATAVLNPGLAANPWNRALHRWFGDRAGHRDRPGPR